MKSETKDFYLTICFTFNTPIDFVWEHLLPRFYVSVYKQTVWAKLSNKFYLYLTVKINTRVEWGMRHREIFRSTRFPLTVILYEAIVWVLNDNNAVVFDCWDWYWYFRSYRCRFCVGHYNELFIDIYLYYNIYLVEYKFENKPCSC